jgi:hypothetical protein
MIICENKYERFLFSFEEETLTCANNILTLSLGKYLTNLPEHHF